MRGGSVEGDSDENHENECAICYRNINDPGGPQGCPAGKCKTKFCQECLTRAQTIRKKCPGCNSLPEGVEEIRGDDEPIDLNDEYVAAAAEMQRQDEQERYNTEAAIRASMNPGGGSAPRVGGSAPRVGGGAPRAGGGAVMYRFTVQVGMRPGQVINIQIPNGPKFHYVLPANASPGQQIMIPVSSIDSAPRVGGGRRSSSPEDTELQQAIDASMLSGVARGGDGGGGGDADLELQQALVDSKKEAERKDNMNTLDDRSLIEALRRSNEDRG